jgi:cob(I)alamin adenosyltransferase
MSVPREDRKGLVLIYTGDGKGKTTAALGMAVRAMGYHYRTLMIQFIKGTWNYGELMQGDRFGDLFDIEQVGLGYVGIRGDKLPREKHAEAARRGLEKARAGIATGKYDIVILDEVNVAVQLGILDLEEVKKVILEKPPYLHLILTGRGAKEELIELADLVTEVRSIKHPYDKGIVAQEGVEY